MTKKYEKHKAMEARVAAARAAAGEGADGWRRALEQRDWLAEALGMDKGALDDEEKFAEVQAEVGPDIRLVRKICNGLGVSPPEMMREIEERWNTRRPLVKAGAPLAFKAYPGMFTLGAGLVGRTDIKPEPDDEQAPQHTNGSAIGT